MALTKKQTKQLRAMANQLNPRLWIGKNDVTDAAIKGKTDPLIGLKENVIIGKLLPSGTGMKCYSEVEIEPVAQETTAAEDVTA